MSKFISFSLIIIAVLSLLPQTVCFIRNDMFAVILTILYFLTINKYIVPKTIVWSVLIVSLPYIFVSTFVTYSGDIKYGGLLPFMTIWTLLIPLFSYVATYNLHDEKVDRVVFVTTLLVLAYISFNTLMALVDDPNVMRNNEGDIQEGTTFYLIRMQGIGNYGYAYSMGAIFVTLWGIRSHMDRKYKYLGWAALAFTGYVVVASQYATLFFLVLFSIFFRLILNARTISKKFLLVILAIIVYYAAQGLVHLGISTFDGQVLGQKFQYVYDGLWGSGNLEQISADRSEKQWAAILVFLQSPIWGNSLTNPITLDVVEHAHSTIGGVLATTGLIGFCSFVFTFYKAIKYQMESVFDNDKRMIYLTVIFYYAVFSILNPVETSFETSWTIFFFIPLLINMFYETTSIN